MEQNNDLEIEIEQKELETPAPSLRETIEKARDEAIEKETIVKEAKVEKKPRQPKGEGRERDETGKFLGKETQEIKSNAVAKETQQVAVVAEEPPIPPPQAYNGAVKAKWNELPRDIQQELSVREQYFHRELTKHDEERNFGRTVDRIVQPYMAQIKAEGATAPQAIESLLNMAHVLRVGSPQQKSDLLLRTAQTFGVDLRSAVQQPQQQIHPQIQTALQEVQAIKSRLEQADAAKKAAEEAELQQTIKEFSENPKNIHFEAVKAHMASLLVSGLAKDLQDAYDQAVYANPQTRSTLLEQQKSASNEQRVAEQKARAEAARKAGSSIKGAPGMVASKNGQIKGLDLRSTLKAAFAEHRE
jgi:gas vesicle protein